MTELAKETAVMSLPLVKRFLLHSMESSDGVFGRSEIVSEELLLAVNLYAINLAKGIVGPTNLKHNPQTTHQKDGARWSIPDIRV